MVNNRREKSMGTWETLSEEIFASNSAQTINFAGQHASTTILAPAAACRRTRILAGHSQRAGNATAATCTRRFLQVSVRPVLSVYPQSYLQFTWNSKKSKCNIRLYNMIKCSANKSLVPTWHTLLGMRRIQKNFFERQLWLV